jgi:hypothetical protein
VLLLERVTIKIGTYGFKKKIRKLPGRHKK